MTDPRKGPNVQETDARSGPFGRGGGRVIRVQLRFSGRLGPEFEAFVRARALRLSVRVAVICDMTQAIVEAEGVEAMIGALEMAACIGPEPCSIDSWSCSERP